MNDPIIDAHHHIWRVAKVPWLSGPQLPRIFGDYGALRRESCFALSIPFNTRLTGTRRILFNTRLTGT